MEQSTVTSVTVVDAPSSTALSTTTLPNGEQSTVTGFTVVDAPSSTVLSTTILPNGEQSTVTGFTVINGSHTGAAATSPSSGTSPPSSSASNTSGVNSSGRVGLSTGAIAGIAVGVGLVALAALAGLLWYIFRLKRALKAKREPASSAEYPPGRYEKDGTAKYELNAVENQIHAEAEGDTPIMRAELP